MSTKDPIVGVYAESVLRATASIMGPSSVAAQALREADRRRAKGEYVAFYRTRSDAIIIGPYADEMMKLIDNQETE